MLLGVAGVCAAAIVAGRRLRRRNSSGHFDLSGKGVLVTGGSRGFGLALAREFGSRGARLVLCARDEKELERACTSLGGAGIEAHALAADITEADHLNDVVQRAIGYLGAIDVLVNDAGRIAVGSFDAFTRQDYEDAMKLMFWAPVNLTFAVLKHMRERGSGHIVNISSVGGRVSIPHLLPYSCAKFAFTGFSTGLGTELNSTGIDVLTVVPGLMRTGSYRQAEFKGASQEEFAWFGVLGNLPGFSMAAEHAAREVWTALEAGDEVCTISFPAKVLVALEALAPEALREIMGLAERFLLPESGSKKSQPGKSLNAKMSALFQGVTALGKLAAIRLNEV